jgi:hypothetical protein
MKLSQIIVLVIISFTVVITSFGATLRGSGSKAEILGLNAPFEISDGDTVCLQVIVRNTDFRTRSFYIGASILVVGEKEWIKLPGWGYTAEINPGNTTFFMFRKHIIQTSSDVGYYDIRIIIWSDSLRTSKIFESWYPARTNYWWNMPSSRARMLFY